jgi:hypothetical protein
MLKGVEILTSTFISKKKDYARETIISIIKSIVIIYLSQNIRVIILFFLHKFINNVHFLLKLSFNY